MTDLIADLKERNQLQDIIPGTQEQLNKEMTAGYVGFDPTADSLHVGSMMPIILLMRLQKAGHKPYALVGGATGMVGDPSGKSAERNLLDKETLDKNCAGIRKQLEKFLDFDPAKPNAAVMVNNYDWFKDFNFLDFIRDVGKHITVSYMMSKDSVQKRLETGLSFTEFSYQLIQGYDFYYMNEHMGVKLQMGGADQWGNIVTGTELIRRKGGKEAFAFTGPLITKSDGSKFGKSEGGNVWLDPERTSPYTFYQFWINMPDDEAEKLSLVFSFKPVEEIIALIAEHREAPHMRKLQKALAEEMTVLVHSREAFDRAFEATNIFFSKGDKAVETLKSFNEKELLEAMEVVPKIEAQKAALGTTDILTFLADNGLFASKGEAKKMIQNGGVSINKEKIEDVGMMLTAEHLLNDKYMLVQKGKSNYTLAIFS
ncbi:MAG: tyrosine--tRNA ligase [Chitinophagales bacterium]|nr:tyrosine--tRNA ligase [Chitinophagales bacterium]